MSGIIDQELQAYGVARVMAFIQDNTEEDEVNQLCSQFVRHPNSLPRLLAADAGLAASTVPDSQYFPTLGIVLGTASQETLSALESSAVVKSLMGTPLFESIRPVKARNTSLTAERTWGINRLKIPSLWDQGLTGAGVRVGHLDTGADGTHETLKTAIVEFAEFDILGRQVSPAPAAWDSDDHGTHTAGTIAGRPVSGRSVGVAHGCDLYSAMVIEGGDMIARVLGGMEWAATNQVRILNMSLGFRGFWDDFLDLTQRLRELEILPIFAVGNEGIGTSRSPGNYSEALSVGAMNQRNKVTLFSSSDRFARENDPIVPDLVAPGASVVSAKPGGGYQSLDGTSMATPHIAGLAALLMEAKPNAGIDEIERSIFESCTPLPNTQGLRQNRGIPDATVALNILNP